MNSPLWAPDFDAYRPLALDFIDLVNEKHNAGLKYAYADLHRWSIENRDNFWDILWDFSGVIGDKGGPVFTAQTQVPYGRFFPEGRLNYTENMLAYWQENPSEKAIIYRHQDSADRVITGQELCEHVSIWEQALRAAGIGKDDVVGVYLPNVPETDIILLAAANIGAVFCSAGMEMGGDDLIGRFGAVAPKIIISAKGYRHGNKDIDRSEILERVQAEVKSVQQIVYVPVIGFENVRDDFLGGLSSQPLVFEKYDFNQPLYILFSSGSTGVPKCFVHGAGGTILKHMGEYLLQADVQKGDVTFFHATPSWMMWNWASSCLMVGAVLLKYDGNPFTPDVAAQLRFTAEHDCTHHGTAAPVIMAWRDQGLDVTESLDLSSLRCITYTGAVLPAQGFEYIQEHIKKGVQISGTSGGTDIVASFICGNPLTPVYAGQIAGPIFGIDIQIWSDEAERLGAGESGELVCVNAFPSMPLYFYDDEDGARYRDAYFDYYADKGKQVWRHGDTIKQTEQGQLMIIGRSDATLNQNGVRIGTVVLYNQLECVRGDIQGYAAVDFVRPDSAQTITILFLALENYQDGAPEDMIKKIRSTVKENVGPYSVPTEIIAVPDVLRTKNGKLAEVVMKKIINGASIPNPKLYGADLVKFYEGLAQDLKARYS